MSFKKIVCAIIALLILVSCFVGCTKNKTEETNSDPTEIVEATEGTVDSTNPEDTTDATINDTEGTTPEESETVEIPNESVPEGEKPNETDPTEESTTPTEPEATEHPKQEETKPQETKPEETKPTEPKPEETKPEEQKPTTPTASYKEVNETVYATSSVNVRTGPSTDYEKVGQLKEGESVTRIGVGDNGWSKVIYKEKECYISSNYLSTTKPVPTSYPLTYSDSTATITIYKEWFENAWCYAAHLEFTDYSRFGTDCANGAYKNGYETTSHAPNRLGAIFAVNGCYSAPNLGYTVVRSGKIWNGAEKSTWLPAIYSNQNGLFLSAWESNGTPGIAGKNVKELVDAGLFTDSFCFGPPILTNGTCYASDKDTSRAQRTFIGTNGNAGDIWVVVSDGRYNDGESAGLTYNQMARFLVSKGCTFGIPLDGGGSSTMYFNGKVLNAAKGNQRAVVDFVYFK